MDRRAYLQAVGGVALTGCVGRESDRLPPSTGTTGGSRATSDRSTIHESYGTTQVRVGGVGWRDSVRVRRTGWNAIGGGTVYRVGLAYGDRNVTAYTSPPARADPVIAGRNVTLEAAPEGFRLNVSVGNRSSVAPMPATNQTISVGGLEFLNVEGRVYALNGGTRVRVARQETYE